VYSRLHLNARLARVHRIVFSLAAAQTINADGQDAITAADFLMIRHFAFEQLL
jgi:hypothetical protein